MLSTAGGSLSSRVKNPGSDGVWDVNINVLTDDDPESVTITQVPSLVLTKTGTLDMTVVAPNTVANPGDTITYSFSVQNTGNVTLHSIAVTDPMLPSLVCTITTLAPGASSACTASSNVYTLTQADIDYRTLTSLVDINDGYLLEPGELVLGITRERITLPEDLCGWLNSRSRFARIG
jgi:uncharacterized repeat protein (TIGR01451 family)